MSNGIPLVDLGWQHAQIAAEVTQGFDAVMASGAFIDGPDVGAFEEEFAAFSGARFAIGCGSGTDALEIAFRAAGLGAGDEVIIPANTFAATAEAVVRFGGRPVFVDVDPTHLLIDVDAVKNAVTNDTRAIAPVHLYGQLAPMAALAEIAAAHDLAVIGDAAQAQGAAAGSAGIATGVTAAATSFYPGKNLGAYGDGGAVVTDDPEIAALVRSIGHHGVDADRYQHVRFGFTSRLDTLHAVVLRAKLARLHQWNALRREAAARYDDLLAGVDGVVLPATLPGNEHVWHLYVVRVDRRDAVLDTLRQTGIGAGVHYPVPLHLQPVFAGSGGAHPVAERAAATVLSLPLFPGITAEQQATVAEALIAAVRTPA